MPVNPVLILGVGNTLFTDDGAGVYAVRVARKEWHGDGVDFAEAAVGGFELLHHLVGYQAVLVVDAAVTCMAQPGEIFTVNPAVLPATLSTRTYGAGLGTALSVGRSLNLPMPGRLELLVIEAQDISTVGDIPTTPVADAIRPAAREILRIAAQMRSSVTNAECLN